ncbi:MAG: hypothetical protein KBS91_04710 [Firmicutes bacterium]|nr:hypothetical protein [Candidatus Caballimonas caccae]
MKTTNNYLEEQANKIYSYLMEEAIKDNTRWVSQFEIAQKVFNYDGIEEGFHDTAVRHNITNAIRKLKTRDDVQMVVLSSGHGNKIANDKEIDKYLNNQLRSAIRSISIVRKSMKKAGRNGQLKYLVDEQEYTTIKSFVGD